MRITRRTRTRDVLPLMYGDIAEEVLERMPPYPLRKAVVDMTVGEFCKVLTGEAELEIIKARRAFVAFGRLKQLREELKGIETFLKSISVEPTIDEKNALARVTVRPSEGEILLVEAKEAFNLDRLERRGRFRNPFHPAAEDVPLAELLVIKKNAAAANQYSRAFNNIMMKKKPKR